MAPRKITDYICVKLKTNERTYILVDLNLLACGSLSAPVRLLLSGWGNKRNKIKYMDPFAFRIA